MSNETKWTKGPWSHALRNANEIMTTFHGVQIGRIYIDVTTDNEAEDAHLIAAAPELADALMCWPLNELLGMVEDSGDAIMWERAKWFIEVRDFALAKARGEAS